eukprot:TRINITY_DN6937_c0_g1_i3.p1 TRINITY_DN6937_c0_g1~~TRINITY_DN6937_c0_g1_i3.p1  ORF type:complete len:409 (-),score=66.31 TRINITY_DN6937_c0_g1_i3:121-1347(-)
MLPGAVAIFAERAGQDKCWHPSCFTCCSCGELLEDLLYFYAKGKLYCGRDFARMMDIPRCAACDELIFATEYTGAEDQYWHLKHFCCFNCDTPLAGQKYIPVNSQPHCLKCWQQLHGKVCQTCKDYIHPEDQRVTLGESHWHAKSECFKCGICSKSLLGAMVTRKEGTLLCSSACAAKLSELKARSHQVPQHSPLSVHTSQHLQRGSQSSLSPRVLSPEFIGGEQASSSQLITAPGAGGHYNSSGQSAMLNNGHHNGHAGMHQDAHIVLGNRPGPQMPPSNGMSRAPPSTLSTGSTASVLKSPLSSTSSTGSVLKSPSSPVPSSILSQGPVRKSPQPGPKPGTHMGTSLPPYQPLLHVQQPRGQHQGGRHVQFANSIRHQQDQSSDGYSSNHSTPPFHSRESSYSTIV